MTQSTELLGEWENAEEDQQARFAHQLFTVHFRRAQILAREGDFEKAAFELREEAALQGAYGGVIEHSSKNPDSFFRQLIELQALLTDRTGADPLEGRVDYVFDAKGKDYVASRLEKSNEIAGYVVEGVGEEDSIARVHRVVRNGDKFVASDPCWLIGHKASLREVLANPIKKADLGANGRVIVAAVSDRGPILREPRRPEAVPSAPVDSPSSMVTWIAVIVAVGLAIFVARRVLGARSH